MSSAGAGASVRQRRRRVVVAARDHDQDRETEARGLCPGALVVLTCARVEQLRERERIEAWRGSSLSLPLFSTLPSFSISFVRSPYFATTVSTTCWQPPAAARFDGGTEAIGDHARYPRRAFASELREPTSPAASFEPWSEGPRDPVGDAPSCSPFGAAALDHLLWSSLRLSFGARGLLLVGLFRFGRHD